MLQGMYYMMDVGHLFKEKNATMSLKGYFPNHKVF